MFSDNEEIQLLDHLIKKCLADIDYLVNHNKRGLEESNKILGYIIDMNPPQNLNGQDSQSIILKQQKSFANVCISLEKNGCIKPKEETMYDFYSRIVYYSKKKQSAD